jgi:ectoine hydroxylase-related dioxygenase (phytanoyl-CoA dioxygenase family)
MAGFDIDQHVNELEREGYTIIRDVLPPEEIEKTKQAINLVLDAERETATKYGLQNEDLQMCYNAQGKHPYFYGLALRHQTPVQVIRRVLGDDMFAHNVAIRKPLPTGKKDWTKLGGYLHADWHHFTIDPFIGGKHYAMAIQSVWAIAEFTEKTGATYLWPGSHLKNEIPPEQPETLPLGYIRAEAPAGSVILWDSALWHTSGANCGDSPRYSLVYYFHRWWLKGFNDSYRLVPAEIRQQMTLEERTFWGLEAKVPPNTHFREMSKGQIAALTPQEKTVLNIAAF